MAQPDPSEPLIPPIGVLSQAERMFRVNWVAKLLSPAYAGVQMFVNHPQVSDYLRRQLAAFLAEQRDLWDDEIDPAALLEQLRGLAARQLAATLGHLAQGLPIYDLWFDRQGNARVEAAGVVGSGAG